MEYLCGFCDFKSENRTEVAKHWERCGERKVLDLKMELDCEGWV